ncbi:MAG: MBOAT family protein [Chloroflexi bacterium]|nr:MBOAT family protein [Chloroflexota bacterium]
MLFNSFQFALFFPVVVILYFLLPHKHRWWFLLGASAYFYMAFVPSYILILGATIVVDYFAGIWIEEARSSGRKKTYLLLSLIANIGFLVFFKYFDFLNTNLSGLADMAGWNYSPGNLKIILPIGLSFHTFQAMSYTVEVFRGHQKAERHFGIYALYVLFYPQLVAGPIERPQNMLHQFHEEHFIDYQRVTDGLKLMTWGLFKKVVIADRLAPMVSHYYNSPERFSGPELALATVLFAVQIFCDFSGYSDIAIGAAQVMGFKLMANFKRPYLALSISEFWERWHISLSTWFRDYLYIPLGGRRVSVLRWQINLFIVFLVSGLWHGANWTFVIWGALHGVYRVAEIYIQKLWGAVPERIQLIPPLWILQIFQRIFVLMLVCFAWVFFRSPSLESALFVTGKILTDWSYSSISEIGNTLLGNDEFFITLFFILIMEVVHYFQERGSLRILLAKKHFSVRWALYVGVLVCIIVFGQIYQKPTEFVYFKF